LLYKHAHQQNVHTDTAVSVPTLKGVSWQSITFGTPFTAHIVYCSLLQKSSVTQAAMQIDHLDAAAAAAAAADCTDLW